MQAEPVFLPRRVRRITWLFFFSHGTYASGPSRLYSLNEAIFAVVKLQLSNFDQAIGSSRMRVCLRCSDRCGCVRILP